MRHVKLIGVLLMLLAVAANASAQSGSGTMFGSVVDTQGQVVPGADVIATNEATREERRGVTNAVGDYVIAGLAPGPYSVRAELAGFKPFVITGNQVLANNRLAVPVLRLEVGALTETVSVSAVGEVVATGTTAHQAILDLKQVQNLSIRGRDPISLLKILPGVALLANDQETFGGSFATPVPAIQGQTGGNTIYVDGVNGGDGGAGGGGGGNFSAATNMDAIAEVNVQMSAYTAEYGMKGGAQVNYITKHGGSEYHGSGYWYKRHESWNATNFFNNRSNLPKPQYRYSTLGGTLGGPIPRIKKINENGNKLFFFYSIDDTRLKDVNTPKFYMMPTALERAGDFSQSRTPSGALIVVTDPNTGQPFPGNVIPSNRIDPRGVAMLNLFPMPNTTGVAGYNYVTQEASIPHPRQQHILRVDYRPTDRDSLAVKYQTFYTKSVGINVAGASARWGLVRQRYDFFVDMGKIDYTRVINSTTVFEFSTGFFSSVEDGPPEDDTALRGIQRSTYPQIARLGQLAAGNNALSLIPQAQFGRVPSADRDSNNDGGTGQITYDGRWPITGNDIAVPVTLNLTHARGRHTYKVGLLREEEFFGQARSGTFAGQFNFADDANDPRRSGHAYANAVLGNVRAYTESLGRVPDNRRQRTWAGYLQDTWKAHRTVTVDAGLRMYKWGPPLSQSGEGSGFTFDRFDPAWGGNPPVLFRPVLSGGARRAQNPLTGQILPATFIGLIVPGTGYSCGVITPDTPCKINGVVTQRDGNYLDGADEGFTEPAKIQFDPRVGVAWAPNAKTVVRVAGGSFHDSSAGSYFQQGNGNVAYRYTQEILYTDMDSDSTGSGGTAIVPSTNGVERTDNRLPNVIRYTAAVQREIGKNIVVDAAYVGSRTKYLNQDVNYNILPFGVRFLPTSRDPTQTPTATSPGALPDQFLRPILGFNDINIGSKTGRNTYDSMQVQVTRRFTGGYELAGSYTLARGYEHEKNEQLPSLMQRRDIQEHVLVASYQYQVPNGSALFGGNKGAAWVLDNWMISGISTFATGPRGRVGVTYSPGADFIGGGQFCDGANPGGAGPFNIIGTLDLPSSERNVDRWFDTANVAPASGRGDRGNEAACDDWQFTLPGFNNHDLSFFKDIKVKGNQLLQYRLEIYNVFNSVSFNAVNSTATFNPTTGAQTNSNFGKVTSARNERRMQMSIKYVF